MTMSNFERKYSPGYRHMICTGQTKSTSEKGLLSSLSKETLASVENVNGNEEQRLK